MKTSRGRPGRQHGAVDQHDLVAEIRHAAEIVGRDQHQVAGRAQFAQQGDDRRFGLHVDAGERLVEQDDAAFLRQRARQEHALLLAAAQFADLARAVVAHADALQRLVDLVAVGARRHAQEIHVAVAAHHHHVLDQHREIPVDVLALRHIGDDVAS